jgi:2-hydroxymuconate-semialdehyde hydrolase
MLHGRNDIAFPPSNSLDLAAQLPQADVALLAQCSHSVAFERPGTFLALASEFFGAAMRPT